MLLFRELSELIDNIAFAVIVCNAFKNLDLAADIQYVNLI